ncbi:MAG: CdaR family transcriptional regulator [Tuberibacillus sp.]
MKLNAELAKKIVIEARSSLNEHFIIVDTSFRIIASSDPKRTGDFHEGAKRAIEEDRTIIITPNDAGQMKGVKPGINMPIKHDGQMIGVIGITGHPDDVRPYAELIRRLTELFIREVIQAEQLESQSRAIESFVYQWVHKETIDKDFIEQSEILGLSITEPYLVIMGQFIEPVTEAYKLLNTQFLRVTNSHLVRWSDQKFLLLIHQSTYVQKILEETLRSWMLFLRKESGLQIKLGVSKTPRAALIRPSFIEAQTALHTATSDQPIVFYESLSLDILLQDISEDSRDAFIQNTWKTVLENTELTETLLAYLTANLSVSKAAKALHIHVNTLHYRLKRMEELTGLNLRTTEGIVSAYLAARLQDLF